MALIVAPQDVLSPRSRLTPPLTVVHTTAEWSLATALWDGKRALLIRWNGNAGSPRGNPVSHGNPTWFVVPGDLHWHVLAVAPAQARLKAAAWLSGAADPD